VAIVHRRGEMHCVSEVLHPLMDHADSHPMFEIRRTCATQSMTDFTFGGAVGSDHHRHRRRHHTL